MCIYHPGFFFKTCSKNTWKKGPKIILSVCTNPKISPVLSTKEMIEQNFLSIQFNRPSHVLHTHLLCKYSHCLCINEIINEWNVEYFQETLPSLGCLAHLTFFIIFFVLLFFFNTWRDDKIFCQLWISYLNIHVATVVFHNFFFI